MPTFELEKDGKTYEVEAPDQAAALSALPHVESAAAATPPAPSSWLDAAKEGGKGLVRGAVSAAGGAADEFLQPFKDVVAAGRYAAGKPNEQKADPGLGTQAVDALGVKATPQTTAGKYAGTAGDVLGNPVTYAGPGGVALKVGSGVASALASEGAGELAESAGASSGVQGAARLAGGMVGGTAAATAGAERNLKNLSAELPTRENIKAAATAGYDMLKQSNVRISEQGTQALLADVKKSLQDDHFRDYLAPNTFRAIEELGVNGSATIGDLDGVRKLLGRVPVVNPTDRAAANKAISAIDDFLTNVPQQYVLSGDPAHDAAILKHAQGNWKLHKQLEMLEDASVKGQHRAGVSGSGANRINTARQEVRKILDSDKKSRGLSPEVKDKMEEIVMGTWLSNKARSIGKFAPSGPVSATTSILGGMHDMGLGIGIAVGGFLSKHLGEYLTDRQIGELEALMRSESPIGKPIAKANAPAVAEQQAVPAAAAVRSALTSPLAPGGMPPPSNNDGWQVERAR